MQGRERFGADNQGVMMVQSRYVYLVLNLAVSLAAFGRNLVFMRVFGLADLGQIALMQTIVMLVGFSQIGLVSGSFILWAGGEKKLNESIANLMFCATLLLAVGIAAVLLMVGPNIFAPVVAAETLIIGLTGGLATMASSWMNNALVADQRLLTSSGIGVAAVAVSFVAALETLRWPELEIALVAMALQPLLVMIGVLTFNRGVRPTELKICINTVRRVLSVGIQPYLGSLAVLALYQVERWSIIAVLGPEALGRYYIVILFLGFFTLVPVALMNINFPLAVQAVHAGDDAVFRKVRRRHTLELAAFAVGGLVLMLIFLVPVLELSLPQFVDSTPLLYLAYIAGVAFMMQDIGTLMLYAIQRTGDIFIAGCLTLGSFSTGIFCLWMAGALGLETILYMRVVASLIGALWLFVVGKIRVRDSKCVRVGA